VRNIALIGFRATGKSSVGKILAQMLGCTFVDMDHYLTASAGREIECWVRLDGWESFRRAESELLQALGSKEDLVVATGGGVVLAPENREVLNKSFFTVWLKAGAETIHSRILSDPASAANRPPLSELPMEVEIRKLISEREPLYELCADIQLDSERTTPAQIAEKIMEGFRDLGTLGI